MTPPPPTPSPDPRLHEDAAELHQALKQLLRVYQFRDRDRICCHDVSVTQCHALERLAEAGPMSQNELASALFLDKSTTSRVVGTLERKGYLARRPDPNDGRARRLEITEAGRALVETIEADILAREARILAPFPGGMRRSMARLIRELAAAQSAQVDVTGGTCCTVG
jgi:MarR family transcriptional regulator, 2-MHQ and catechol-resistance regulon repressor